MMGDWSARDSRRLKVSRPALSGSVRSEMTAWKGPALSSASASARLSTWMISSAASPRRSMAASRLESTALSSTMRTRLLRWAMRGMMGQSRTGARKFQRDESAVEEIEGEEGNGTIKWLGLLLMFMRQ